MRVGPEQRLSVGCRTIPEPFESTRPGSPTGPMEAHVVDYVAPSPAQKRFSRLKMPFVCLYSVTNSPKSRSYSSAWAPVGS